MENQTSHLPNEFEVTVKLVMTGKVLSKEQPINLKFSKKKPIAKKKRKNRRTASGLPICSFCHREGHTQKHCYRKHKLCLACGSADHKVSGCPKSKGKKSSAGNQLLIPPPQVPTVQCNEKQGEASSFEEKEEIGAVEGINVFLSGPSAGVDGFMVFTENYTSNVIPSGFYLNLRVGEAFVVKREFCN